MAPQTRLQAFSIHLTVSLLIFIIAAAMILAYWYPGHFRYFGGIKGVALIAGIDLLLGPALTLLVFDRRKKSLKWDMGIVVLIQTTALFYGFFSVQQGRPLAQILTHEGVYIATKADLGFYGVDVEELKKASSKIPIKAYLDLPTDLAAINQIEFLTGFMSNRPLALRVDLYREFPPENPQQLDFLLDQHQFDATDNCYVVPIISSHKDLSACLNPKTASLDLRR